MNFSSEFVNEFTITGLKENGKYSFKIAAVNEEGTGEFIHTDKPIVIKRLFGTLKL